MSEFEQYMMDTYGISPSALDALDAETHQEYEEEFKQYKLLERGKTKEQTY